MSPFSAILVEWSIPYRMLFSSLVSTLKSSLNSKLSILNNFLVSVSWHCNFKICRLKFCTVKFSIQMCQWKGYLRQTSVWGQWINYFTSAYQTLNLLLRFVTARILACYEHVCHSVVLGSRTVYCSFTACVTVPQRRATIEFSSASVRCVSRWCALFV